MRRAQESNTTRRQRFPQPHATYKISSAANIPIRNVLVESRRSDKHCTLWKQEEWYRIVVHSSDDIRQRKEWYEICSLMTTMSMIIKMHEQYSIPSRTATTETMRRPAQESNTTRRQRFPQPHATYKISSAANIPTRNVLVESRRINKHCILSQQ